MKLLRLFLQQPHVPKARFLAFLALAGISNVLLLAVLNTAAQHASQKSVELLLVVAFVVTIAIFVLTQKFVWKTTTTEVASLVHDIRVRIFNKIAAFELEHLEKAGKADFYAAINQHTYTLTVSALPIVVSLQSVILIGFTLVYLAYLSLMAFVVALVSITAAIGYSIKRSHDTNRYLDTAIAAEQNVYYTLTDLIEGFKEVKLNGAREQDLLAAADRLSLDARDNRIVANVEMALNFIGTNTLFYFLLAALVFLVPQLSGETYPEIVVKITTAGLFLIGPIISVVSIMPTYAHAEMAVGLIEKTEALLDAHREQLANGRIAAPEAVRNLALRRVTYEYHDADGGNGFTIGPASMEIAAGEIIFLTGGNGSGKTTLIKVLLGLYAPSSGMVLLNGATIEQSGLKSYRNLFSTVLSDYHLFAETHGLRKPDPVRVDDLLQKMGLTGKTHLVNGRFDTLNMSTGQRKRLALIVAILEDRPIMVFDEWAADQDPEFRKTFYYQILPELKANGKTIIAVTHDERYFDCCDRHFHMEEGLINEVMPRP